MSSGAFWSTMAVCVLFGFGMSFFPFLSLPLAMMAVLGTGLWELTGQRPLGRRVDVWCLVLTFSVLVLNVVGLLLMTVIVIAAGVARRWVATQEGSGQPS